MAESSMTATPSVFPDRRSNAATDSPGEQVEAGTVSATMAGSSALTG
jgi:hypothetical protein